MIFLNVTIIKRPGGEAEMIFHNLTIKMRPEGKAR